MRSRALAVFVVVALGFAGAAMTEVHASPGAATPSPAWHLQYPLPTSTRLVAVSCPTAQSCYTGENRAVTIRTDDAGRTWNRQESTLSGVKSSLLAIACPGAKRCFGLDGSPSAPLLTMTNGRTWREAGVFPYVGSYGYLHAITCPTVNVCYVVGGSSAYPTSDTVAVTDDSGAHWLVQTRHVHDVLEAVSCPATAVCYAFGEQGTFMSTSDAGHSWVSQSLPINHFRFTLTALSCPLAGVCYLAGSEVAAGGGFIPHVLVTRDGGTHWDDVTSVAGARQLFGITCSASGFCLVAGNTDHYQFFVAVSKDGGQTWTATSTADTGQYGSFSAVACSSDSQLCALVGDWGALETTSDQGTSWRAGRAEPLLVMLSGVSCPVELICYAAGGGVLKTSDGGRRWNSLGLALTTGTTRIACPAVRTCFLVASSRTSPGSILRTQDGGRTWHVLARASSPFGDIACPSKRVCYASPCGCISGAAAVLATGDGGLTWQRRPLPLGMRGGVVTCIAVPTCFVVGGGFIARTADGGGHWTALNTGMDTGIGSNGASLTGIACPSFAVCFAVAPDYGREWVGVTILRTTDAGRHWTRIYDDGNSIGANNRLYQIACATTRECYVVGEGGEILATTNQGRSWHRQYSDTGNRLLGMTCGHDGRCYAVGDAGTVVERTS